MKRFLLFLALGSILFSACTSASPSPGEDSLESPPPLPSSSLSSQSEKRESSDVLSSSVSPSSSHTSVSSLSPVAPSEDSSAASDASSESTPSSSKASGSSPEAVPSPPEEPSTDASEPWIDIMDHPDLIPAYQHYLEYAPYSTGFLYITTPQGDPVSNIMCYIEDQFVVYSMPCGLVPVPFVMENGLYAAPQQVTLINPNAGEEIYERCIAELDPTAQKAYHLVWNGEPPDEYAKKAENYVTVSMKFEDGTPAANMFSFLCLLDMDPEFEGYPATGKIVPPGGIPDGLIGTNGFRVAIERGRYADAEGNLHFVVGNSWKKGTETMHLSLDVFEIDFHLYGHGYHTPSIPAYDENGELRHSLEAVLTKPSGS